MHFIREVANLTGTHIGCDTTSCGACAVLVNGVPAKSCTMFAVQADGARISTVEGLEQGGVLHPVQEGFFQEHGLQCGFCTPGMMMTAVAFLERNPNPTDEEIRQCHLRQPLPLHRLRQHRQVHPVRGGQESPQNEHRSRCDVLGPIAKPVRRNPDPCIPIPGTQPPHLVRIEFLVPTCGRTRGMGGGGERYDAA